MKLSQEAMVADSALMGHYAENVVANHLRRWPGLVELGYWRDGNEEMDFIVDLGYSRIAVEVKYRNDIQTKDAVKALKYAKKLGCSACIVVSKQPLDVDNVDLEKLIKNSELPLAIVPLAAFLMLF
jgi:predicted AAA+ superfamily ATPase